MIILSPSILAADFTKLGEQMEKAEAGGNDYFHFDVMDGMFVPNISFGIPVLRSVRAATKKVLDVHLMVEAPERYIDKFVDAGADIITVHQEACKPLEETLRHIHERGKRAGVAIKPNTDISVLEPYFGLADMFLVMTVEPGFGGQKLDARVIGKIRELKDSGYKGEIEADGGIREDNLKLLADHGLTVAVMGTALFRQEDLKAAVGRLRRL